ncbi:sensor histidine kinase [Histidinibacterium lentulum]|uniref:histidine kinase n=1 Tax=Histidinibacterium lentulum TaxID=2480588 RepID=A0A3N2QW53_9RHOB|nr:sensor histidine kinase [Histidinibacterium lentulum]ROT99468.1 sensor histidine kinase [Histidinibacterium lentulum]
MGSLLEYASFAPHGYCLLWNPWLIATHVVADLLIALSYFAIPIALVLFLRRRPELRYRGLLALFAAFILLCGLTHLLSLATLWIPVYAAEGALKLVTGLVSATTAVVLFRLVPTLVQIPSPHQLEAANSRLREEISAHEETLAQLREVQQTLESKVEERTQSLTAATARLSVLSREAVHRSRNLLTVVASIARQTARAAPDTETFLRSLLGRIDALGNATAALLETSTSSGLTIRQLAERQLRPAILTFGERLSMDGPETEVNPQAAQQLSLVLHELATNSQKHGVLAMPDGEVRTTWAVETGAREPMFVLEWVEQGAWSRSMSAPEAAIGGGFGSTLLLRIAPATLGGTAEADLTEGFRYRLSVPLAHLRPRVGADHAEELAQTIVDKAWGASPA